MSEAIIFFDGHCRLCNSWVRFVLRYERRPYYRFAPLQSDFASQRLAALGRDAGDLSSVVVLEQGRLWLKSDAAFKLLGQMRWPWRALGALRILPRALRDAVYDLVGRWRYAVFGQSLYCSAARDGAQSRFIEIEKAE